MEGAPQFNLGVQRMARTVCGLSFVSICLFLSGTLEAQTTFVANLDASQTVAPSTSPAKGTCTLVLNVLETEATVNCTHGVSNPTAAHIHNAPPGQAGAVVFGLGDGVSPISIVWNNPSEDALEELFAGNLYINVHSLANPAAAIRGQLPSQPRAENYTLYFAQFGNGGGLTSDIVLQNLSDSETAAGSIQFFDPEGGPFEVGLEGGESQSSVEFSVDPLDVVTVSTDGLGNDALAGSAVVVSSGSLGGVIKFEVAGIGVAGVGSSLPTSRAITPVQRIPQGINTGIAVRNTSEEAISINSILLKEGKELDRQKIDLPVGGRSSQFIDQIFPGAFEGEFSGTVVLECLEGCTFAAIALELDTHSRTFTTLPVSPLR
jgi:hypothetical protein